MRVERSLAVCVLVAVFGLVRVLGSVWCVLVCWLAWSFMLPSVKLQHIKLKDEHELLAKYGFVDTGAIWL